MDAEKALAAAIWDTSDNSRSWAESFGLLPDGDPRRMTRIEWAAAILAALPPDWCGHEAKYGYRTMAVEEARLFWAKEAELRSVERQVEKAEATIARLRKIEEAAAIHAEVTHVGQTAFIGLTELRAALAESPR